MSIKVALIGTGNCASSLVQGVKFYKGLNGSAPGIMHPILGGYHIEDIEFVAAFDVAEGKVGKDLSEAIFSPPNSTAQFAKVSHMGVPVHRGPTGDGLGVLLRQIVNESETPTADVGAILRDTGANIMVSYLPVGSEKISHWYAQKAIEVGCAYINCIPVFLATSPHWAAAFKRAGLPLLGDDVKSQVGATIVHRVLVNLFKDRGVRIDRMYQLNFGGNADFRNLLEKDRLASKRQSKTEAVTSMIPDMPADSVHIGPSDLVPWLQDRKWAYIRIEGTTFGDVPLNLELKLEVWDSPNSAGVVVDLIRCAKLALDRGEGGAIEAPASYYMKSPPVQHEDTEAMRLLEEYIK